MDVAGLVDIRFVVRTKATLGTSVGSDKVQNTCVTERARANRKVLKGVGKGGGRRFRRGFS